MKSMVDESHRIADELEHQAQQKYAKEIAESESARKAYISACEDFARQIRELARQQDDKTRIKNGNCEKCGEELSAGWSYCPDCGREIIEVKIK